MMSDEQNETCALKDIEVSGCRFKIPEYYQQIEALPDDPEGAQVYAVATPYAKCFFMAYEITQEKMIPMSQEHLLGGIREYLGPNQAIIECDACDTMAYSIVKILKEKYGVQYTLTFQRIFKDKIIFLQGSFEEDGTTGTRDSIVYALLSNAGVVGTDDDPFAGWCFDPYDETITTGTLMNKSELRQFDAQFPGSPLMVCRELIDSLIQ